MQVKINGAVQEIAPRTTIAALLESVKLDPRYLAVECNKDLVPRRKHHEHEIQEHDEIEIVTLVGGG